MKNNNKQNIEGPVYKCTRIKAKENINEILNEEKYRKLYFQLVYESLYDKSFLVKKNDCNISDKELRNILGKKAVIYHKKDYKIKINDYIKTYKDGTFDVCIPNNTVAIFYCKEVKEIYNHIRNAFAHGQVFLHKEERKSKIILIDLNRNNGDKLSSLTALFIISFTPLNDLASFASKSIEKYKC